MENWKIIHLVQFPFQTMNLPIFQSSMFASPKNKKRYILHPPTRHCMVHEPNPGGDCIRSSSSIGWIGPYVKPVEWVEDWVEDWGVTFLFCF